MAEEAMQRQERASVWQWENLGKGRKYTS